LLSRFQLTQLIAALTGWIAAHTRRTVLRSVSFPEVTMGLPALQPVNPVSGRP
jgi:hypothetical protein